MGLGRAFQLNLVAWPDGVNTAGEPDLVPPSAVVRGWNTILQSISAGRAVIGKRPVLERWTSVDTSGGTPLVLVPLRTTSKETLLIEGRSNGTVVAWEQDGTAASSTSAWSTSVGTMAGASALDAVFVVAGTSASIGGIASPGARFNGTVWTTFGLEKPSAAATLSTSTSSPLMADGTHEVALSYYDATVGLESSLSVSTSQATTSQSLVVSWTAPANPRVSHVRVYVRSSAVSAAQFWRAAEIATSSTSTTLRLSTDQLNALTLPAPSTTENNPPPATLLGLAWHRQRLFGHDGERIYYSNPGAPEAWDPLQVELVDPDNGQPIRGIFADQDVLLVGKQDSTYLLVGTSPAEWTIQLLSRDLGCVSQASFCSAEGVTYWWSEQGPVRWRGPGSAPELIGLPTLRPTLDRSNLAAGAMGKICAVADPRRELVLFAVPELGETWNSMILPWSTRLECWVSDRWDPCGISVLGQHEGADSLPSPVVGIPGGKGLFKLVSGVVDGGGTGTSFTFTPATATITSLTHASVQGGWAGLRGFIVGPDGTPIKFEIASVSGTTMSFSDTVGPLGVGQPHTFYLGAIDWQVWTPWLDLDTPWFKKRLEFCYLQFSANANTSLLASLGFDFGAKVSKEMTIAGQASSSTWDFATWDTGVWDAGVSRLHLRKRIARTGRAWQLRLRHYLPVSIALLKVGFDGEVLTRNS